MSEFSDEQLAALLSSEPAAAFRALYDRYSGPLLRFAHRFTADSQSAEDILHEVFSELLDGAFRPASGASLKAWLFTVAKNKCLNSIKVRGREVSLGDDEPEAAVQDSNPELALRKLSELESTLPRELSETWLLRKQGLGYQEIATKLSIPLGTVKSRFFRLVAHLREEFEK